MIKQLTGLPDHLIGFTISGKLHDEDYKTFVPLLDAEIAKEGKANILLGFDHFEGWDKKALWDEINFAATHCAKIRRIALVGGKTWEKWMAAMCKPFTFAKVRFFEPAEFDAAIAWLGEVS